MKRRLVFLVMLGGSLALWKGGFGFLPTERTVTFRLPVEAGNVRRFELQVWDETALLVRREEEAAGGLDREPALSVPLVRGPHRAIATVWLASGVQSRTFQLDFDPASDDEVVLHFVR